MSSQIESIIKAAEKYVGIKESPPNSNNVTFNTRYYGRSVSGAAYPWCCAFIWCLFQDIGAPELFYGGGKTASCTLLMNHAKTRGLFYYKNFKRGDLALFDFDGDKTKSEHIGIITEVKNGSVVTIEGNTAIGNDSNGGEVMRRTRSNSLIIGVYRPNYEEDEEMLTQEQFEEMYKVMMEEVENRYDTLDEVPTWARDTVKKLIEKGVIRGTGTKDAAGNPVNLNLSEDVLRILVINDRMGIYR